MSSSLFKWILASYAFLSIGSASYSQTPSDSVRTLDSLWARTYATHDTASALSLFSDDLIVTSASGTLKNRAGELADIRPQSGLKMHYFKTSDVQVRVDGSTAVAVGAAEWKFTYNERPTTMSRRYTAVYVRGGPLGWKMMALHLGRTPETNR